MVSTSCLSAGSGLSDCWFSTSEFATFAWHTDALIEREAKADQPILVGQDEYPDRTRDDAIHQGKQLLALKVETAANCFDPYVNDQSASSTELLKVVPRLSRARALCRTGNATRDHTPLLVDGWYRSEHHGQVFIRGGALLRDRAMRLESTFAVPALQRLGNPPLRVWQTHNRVHVPGIVHLFLLSQPPGLPPCHKNSAKRLPPPTYPPMIEWL